MIQTRDTELLNKARAQAVPRGAVVATASAAALAGCLPFIELWVFGKTPHGPLIWLSAIGFAYGLVLTSTTALRRRLLDPLLRENKRLREELEHLTARVNQHTGEQA
jgi:hypothetical protein